MGSKRAKAGVQFSSELIYVFQFSRHFFKLRKIIINNNKKMNINEAQSKLHSIGPELKSNLETDFDETNG